MSGVYFSDGSGDTFCFRHVVQAVTASPGKTITVHLSRDLDAFGWGRGCKKCCTDKIDLRRHKSLLGKMM